MCIPRSSACVRTWVAAPCACVCACLLCMHAVCSFGVSVCVRACELLSEHAYVRACVCMHGFVPCKPCWHALVWHCAWSPRTVQALRARYRLMLHFSCCILHPASCMLCNHACHILHATFYKSHGACCETRACYSCMLHVTRCKVASCMLHVACHTKQCGILHIACRVLHDAKWHVARCMLHVT